MAGHLSDFDLALLDRDGVPVVGEAVEYNRVKKAKKDSQIGPSRWIKRLKKTLGGGEQDEEDPEQDLVSGDYSDANQERDQLRRTNRQLREQAEVFISRSGKMAQVTRRLEEACNEREGLKEQVSRIAADLEHSKTFGAKTASALEETKRKRDALLLEQVFHCYLRQQRTLS